MAFSEKFLRVPGVIDIAGRQVKRYHVNTLDNDIDEAIQRAAYGFLPRLPPGLDETPLADVPAEGLGAVLPFRRCPLWDENSGARHSGSVRRNA
ncbi:MAG: hypothetical protein JWQ95_4122 [Sphaerisporangium sp.]|nr:hypothetical protein [Sphaerisporangium sp.]